MLSSALGAEVMNCEIVVLHRHTEGRGDPLAQFGDPNVGKLAATVADQMIVGCGGSLKAIGAAVGMHTVHNASVGHGVEIVVDGCHGNAGHFQLGKKKHFVGSEMSVGLIEDLQNQLSLLGHDEDSSEIYKIRLILIFIISQKSPIVKGF